jgi:cytochrome P450 enzyme
VKALIEEAGMTSNLAAKLHPSAEFVFDPNTPEFNFDPFPTLAYMRDHVPVYWWEQAKAWVTTRYDDFHMLMRDPRFSTELRHCESNGPELPDEQLTIHQLLTRYGSFWMTRVDHARFRRIVGPLFTEKAVQPFRPMVQRVVDDALSGVSGNAEFDLVRDFTSQYSLQAMMHILGIPEERREEFRLFGSAVIDAFFPGISGEALAEKMSYLPQGDIMLEEIIEERRARPGDDFLSKLIHAEKNGEVLKQRELLSMVAILITAGVEPSQHFINFTVLTLLKHPDQFDMLRREPGLLRNAVDEVGRYDNFAKLSLPRFPLTDIEIRGVKIAKGQPVHGFFASALRDEAIFPDADRFDIRRELSRNLLYGDGPHVCIGKAMARLIVETAVGTLITRFPGMRLRLDPAFAENAFFRKMTSMPLDLAP